MASKKNTHIHDLKQQKGILILGHRGCRKSDVWENTIPAFQKAFDAGADGIEIDVETTADGRLVVINRWFSNKTFGFFPWERALGAIQAEGRKRGIAVPTFDQVCTFVSAYPASVFNVEIKSCDRFLCRTAKQVAGRLGFFGITHRVIVSSFDLNALFTMKYVSPQTETAHLFRLEDRVTDLNDKQTPAYKITGCINRSGIKAMLPWVDTLHPEIKLIKSRRPLWARYAQRTGRRVNIWTVDTGNDFLKALDIGADIIISDNPEKTLDYRARLNRRAIDGRKAIA